MSRRYCAPYQIDIIRPSRKGAHHVALRPLDPAFPIQRQIAIEASPVMLVNVFTLDKADEQTLHKTREDDAAFMMRQPGFISTQLHRARKPDLSELCGPAVDR